MKDEFKAGDTVHLNPDIPNLTIFGVEDRGGTLFATCRGKFGQKISNVEIPVVLLKLGHKSVKPGFKKINRT